MFEEKNREMLPREQYRMRKVSLYNWGTFSGVHDIAIAESGHLVVGRSGSGKTTILDGMSTVLIPPRQLDFNAAASQGTKKKDRTIVSYVRGTWGEQTDKLSGGTAHLHLRPETTMSAVGITFRNSLGKTISLVRIFWIKGTSTDQRGFAQRATGFGMRFMIVEREFDLRELEFFQQCDFDVRKLHNAFSVPEVRFENEFRPYCDRFRRVLGIESEAALRLLNRTQSAKNMDDLNEFLRDYMLDRPETFDVAQRLVTEFEELNKAHEAVVKAEQQIMVLHPARARYEERATARLRVNELDEMTAALPGYTEQMKIAHLVGVIAELEQGKARATAEVQDIQSALQNKQRKLQDLQDERLNLGGSLIPRLEQELDEQRNLRKSRVEKRRRIGEACAMLGWELSESTETFAWLQGVARDEVRNYAANAEIRRVKIDEKNAKLYPLNSEAVQLQREIDSLRRQSSNIPYEFLDIRNRIADEMRLDSTELPFVGELIQVNADESPWRGAIERLMHSTSLTVLVGDTNFKRVLRFVNETHLGGLLRFTHVTPRNVGNRPLANKSVARKLEVKDGKWKTWIRAELEQVYGDYRCADSTTEMESLERALTRQGLIKHGKARHIKDDRTNIDDRRYWVTGFDNREKLAQLAERGEELFGQIDKLNKEISALKQEDANAVARLTLCQTVTDVTYDDINVSVVMVRIDQIETQLRNLRQENPALLDIEERITKAKADVGEAMTDLATVQQQLKTIERQLTTKAKDLADAQENFKVRLVPSPFVKEALDARFETALADMRNKTITPERILELNNSVSDSLAKDRQEFAECISGCERDVVQAFTRFKGEWKEDVPDMDESLASAEDYFVLLSRLENDRLPSFKERFFTLLKNQSHQNLAALSKHLQQARNDIQARLESVNEILQKEPFNTDAGQHTYMHIEMRDRHIAEVISFRQEIREALKNALSDDVEGAQERFILIRHLVADLASDDPKKERWRELMLDVRKHVEFVGRETNEIGEEVQVWTGGSSKSGGQRQKLAATCLAAALRYQLGGQDLHYPTYAPVVLDEAFDKSDHEFTITIMNIFVKFGFQTIVATPIKSIMALEPFVGGASFIEIRDRKFSGVKVIEYDTPSKKLVLSNTDRRAIEEDEGEDVEVT